jgi:hypothetical protein
VERLQVWDIGNCVRLSSPRTVVGGSAREDQDT